MSSILKVDPRAGSKDLVLPLHQEGVKPVQETLPFGDVAFTGCGPGGGEVDVCVEYKSLEDLLGCMTSGRLAGHQMPGMQQAYDVNWLLVEGIWRASDAGVIEVYSGRGWQPLQIGRRYYMQRDLDAYFMSISQQGGLRIWHTRTLAESARWIARLYRWWQTPWDEHASLQTFNLSGPMVGLFKPPFVRRVAKELPGIGWEKSQLVVDAFPSVAQMVYADEKDWRRIHGIGKTIASNAVAALQGYLKE